MKLVLSMILVSLIVPTTVLAQVVPLRVFGPLSVGSKLPSFSGVSGNGTAIGPTTPAGKFFVHVVNDSLPPTCLNEECGSVGKRILARGGQLIGLADGKGAAEFGVKLISTKPWKFDRSIVVISSKSGQILGIFDNATLDDIEAIVDQFNFQSK